VGQACSGDCNPQIQTVPLESVDNPHEETMLYSPTLLHNATALAVIRCDPAQLTHTVFPQTQDWVVYAMQGEYIGILMLQAGRSRVRVPIK
jgi:hypothetical protein